jgi:SAM-dependent methyltransferase
MKSPFVVLFSDKNWLKVSLDVLNLDSQKNILDVGCGAGTQLAYFARLGHMCVGVELDKDAAQEAFLVNGKLCDFVVADACHLPFRMDFFDIVYSNESMSHVADTKQALAEQTRLVKGGGHLLVRDGNFLFPIQLLDLLFLYPIRTRGRYGGLKWMLNYDKVISDIYGSGYPGKDENIKTLNWWRAVIMNQKGLRLKISTTSFAQRHPNWLVRIFKQFLGQIIVLAEKK